MTAVGGYWIPRDNKKRLYPKVASIAWEPLEGWGEWQETGGDEEKRNGFMAITVPQSWVKQLCHIDRPIIN